MMCIWQQDGLRELVDLLMLLPLKVLLLLLLLSAWRSLPTLSAPTWAAMS
jgi:hypothetical protein